MIEAVKFVGSIVGLLTGVFLVFDRWLRFRPIANIRFDPGYGGKVKSLRIKNISPVDIFRPPDRSASRHFPSR